jgi:hypothetical protein
MKAIFFIFGRHLDLVVAAVVIKEAERLGVYGGVDDLVDSWQDELFFGAGRVEVSVVDTHSPCVFLLLAPGLDLLAICGALSLG